jgi:hypothetical protein
MQERINYVHDNDPGCLAIACMTLLQAARPAHRAVSAAIECHDHCLHGHMLELAGLRLNCCLCCAAIKRGVKLTSTSRPLQPSDLNRFDYIIGERGVRVLINSCLLLQ